MDCNIIKDLMPIYIEKLTSESSNKLIEEHIKVCDSCRKILAELQTDIITSDKAKEINEIASIPDTLIKRIKKNIYEKFFMLGSITLIIGILIGVFKTKIFMVMAFLGVFSILPFAGSVFTSIAISRRKPTLKMQLRSLRIWVFNLSIAFTMLLFLLYRVICFFTFLEFIFDDTREIIIVAALVIIYNIVFSIAIWIYEKRKLARDIKASAETNKRLFIIVVSTFIFIAALITVPAIILEVNRKVDDVNISFIADAAVIGKWTVVDFVNRPDNFNPEKASFKGTPFLKELVFLEGGQMKVKYDRKEENLVDAPAPYLSWTKGYVINTGGDHTVSKYNIKEINGTSYMFFEWKSGDYVYFHRQPSYYVLRSEVRK